MEENSRIKKMWFCVYNNTIHEVEGFSCAPNNPDTWWIPSLGYSMVEKFRLFETRGEALQKLQTLESK